MTQHEVDQVTHELKELLKRWDLGHSILVTTCKEDKDCIDTLVLHLKEQDKRTNSTIIMLDRITQELSKQSETLNQKSWKSQQHQ